MKKLKSYILFREASEVEARLTDDPALKMAKDKLNTLTKQIAEYKQKKIAIDKAYLMSQTDADLKIAIENIVGEKEIGPQADRNPFLVEYLTIASFKRQIDKLQKGIAEDKIKKDDFSQEMKQPGASQDINKKVDEITKRMSTNSSTIASIKKDIDSYQKKLDDKMIKLQKEMNDFVKKITTKTLK